jgi:hypothetical protein
VTTEILSLWRSPLDRLGLSAAYELADRQPRCTIGYSEDFSAMTIFNFGYYVSGVSPSVALTNMFADMTTGIAPLGGRAFSPAGGAGIAIVGSPAGVQIIGVNLQPSYAASPNVQYQQYGLLISGTPTDVLVSGRDMTDYNVVGSAPVSVVGTQTSLYISDCPGYNDQNTPLFATPAQLTSGVSAATSSTPYFGPSVIIYSGVPVALHVFGQTITSSFGVVFLPSPYDRSTSPRRPPQASRGLANSL